jgi:DNA-binding response OmpR family regulator
MKIGLLEDNYVISDYLTTALEIAGHQVYSHVFGHSLVERLFLDRDQHEPPPYDLVIIDLLLPGVLSGAAVIDYLHRTISPETLPIIVISAASESQLEEVRSRFPRVRVLRKPFAIKELLHLIETSNIDGIA